MIDANRDNEPDGLWPRSGGPPGNHNRQTHALTNWLRLGRLPADADDLDAVLVKLVKKLKTELRAVKGKLSTQDLLQMQSVIRHEGRGAVAQPLPGARDRPTSGREDYAAA